MKTAMQELKSRLLIDKRDFPENKQIDATLSDIEELLETEKQQIIDAYWNGHNQTEYSIHIAETYYTSTFETNKENLK